ncbi:hypothetical protein LCGC14_1722640 [marine sediment metagenome]|uniref:Uncharacterized protein n=1 Tax=marine sediment metagenome TaxID=412755 RepID=A0A0F9HC16_9ZZZZ
MANRFGQIATPLEVVDAGADVANQIFRTPARLVGNVAGAIAQAAKNVEADIARPADYSEIPPPPGVLVEPILAGAAHIAEGVIGALKGGVDGVVATADGVLREVRQLTRQ